MTLPLWGLTAAALLALIHVGAQSMALKASVGNRWTIGPRDNPAAPGPLAARLDRALRNYTETATAFVALAAALAISGHEGRLVDAGILAWIAGRSVYLPAYALAIPYARTAAWLVATAGIAAMLIGLIFA